MDLEIVPVLAAEIEIPETDPTVLHGLDGWTVSISRSPVSGRLHVLATVQGGPPVHSFAEWMRDAARVRNEATAEERAAVVSFLRKWTSVQLPSDPGGALTYAILAATFANAIEHGNHLREAEAEPHGETTSPSTTSSS
jgi:hypothetical protein